MKNLKLLLATTAILSMSAMGANADGVTVNVHVGIRKPSSTLKVQDVEFGDILLIGGQKLDVTMDPATGNLVVTPDSADNPDDPSAYYLTSTGTPTNGIVIATSDQHSYGSDITLALDIPSQVTLTNHSGRTITYYPAQTTISDEEYTDFGSGEINSNTFGIGGRIAAPGGSINQGEYTGSFTATVIETY